MAKIEIEESRPLQRELRIAVRRLEGKDRLDVRIWMKIDKWFPTKQGTADEEEI